VLIALLSASWACAEERGAAQPEVWRFPERPSRIHIAKGLWWDMLRIHEAGAQMGGAIYGESFDVFGDSHGYCGYGKTLGDFPHSCDQLLAFNAVIITGCRAGALPKASQENLKLWVQNGGGLLVTGGIQGLGQGEYHGSILEELLPAEVARAPDLRREPANAILTPTEAGRALFGDAIPWVQRPRLFYAHDGLQPRKGAEVLVEVGGKPVFLRHSLGQGRVALFAGTVCGEPKPEELPFWEWDGWPIVLAKVLDWLVQTPVSKGLTPAAVPRDADYAQKLQQLKELAEVDVDEVGEEEESPNAPKKGSDVVGKVMALAPACRDATFALAVVKALAESGTSFEPEAAEKVFAPIANYLSGKEFARPAKDLAASASAGRVALGLRVLGRVKASEGYVLALRYTASGLAGLPKDAREAALSPGIDAETGKDERLRLAAVRAVADYADRSLLVPFGKAASQWKVKASPPPEVEQLQTDLEEEISLALCLMGDGRAAVTVVNALVRNKLAIERNLDITQRPLYVPTPAVLSERKQAEREIPYLRARNVRLEITLARFPEAGLPVLADLADQWEGEFPDVYLQACLARRDDRPLESSARDALFRIVEKCRLRGVRTLCAHRLRATDSERLVELLVKLSGGSEDDALFALSQLALVPEGQRQQMVRSGLEHQSPRVRRKAVRSILLTPEPARDSLNGLARQLAKDDEIVAGILE
jgi:uncharacterized membrane protein